MMNTIKVEDTQEPWGLLQSVTCLALDPAQRQGSPTPLPEQAHTQPSLFCSTSKPVLPLLITTAAAEHRQRDRDVSLSSFPGPLQPSRPSTAYQEPPGSSQGSGAPSCQQQRSAQRHTTTHMAPQQPEGHCSGAGWPESCCCCFCKGCNGWVCALQPCSSRWQAWTSHSDHAKPPASPWRDHLSLSHPLLRS